MNTDKVMDKIARINALRGIDEMLRVKQSENQRLLQSELRELVEVLFGVTKGSTVYRRGEKYIVAEVENAFLDNVLESPPRKPWLSAHPIKKDGTTSTAVRNLYSDWTTDA